MPDDRDAPTERRPPRASGLTWIASGLAVAAVGVYLVNRDPDPGARPSGKAQRAHTDPAMMNNTTRFPLVCAAAAPEARIVIAPYSRSFVPAGAYRCRPPVPQAPIRLGPGDSLDFEVGDGSRIAIRRPSAYPS